MTSEYDELLARLDGWVASRIRGSLANQATAAIRALTAQVVELTNERDSWAFRCGEANGAEDIAIRRAEQAEAQVVERDAVIEQAPHYEECDSRARIVDWKLVHPSKCDCFKSQAPRDALAARDAVRDKTVRATALRDAAGAISFGYDSPAVGWLRALADQEEL